MNWDERISTNRLFDAFNVVSVSAPINKSFGKYSSCMSEMYLMRGISQLLNFSATIVPSSLPKESVWVNIIKTSKHQRMLTQFEQVERNKRKRSSFCECLWNSRIISRWIVSNLWRPINLASQRIHKHEHLWFWA